MRKVTLILSMVALASFAMAQVQGVYAPIKEQNKQTLQKKATKAEGDVIWSVSFEESPAVWTMGHDQGTKEWFVADTTPNYGFTSANYQGGTVPVPPLWIYMGWRYVHDYSESGAMFAGVDGISDLLGVGGNTPQICNTWIQFDGLDLTGVMAPKLSFYQNYKALNAAYSYIDFSTDGGTTWTAVEINENVEGNSYGDMLFEKFVGEYIANQPNVSMRFRWQTTTAAIGGYGYGWELDDIAIVENPQNDLKLVGAVMNFFQYIDYTTAGQEGYFHYSSHYGMIPNEQFASDFAIMLFNGMVENKGMNAVAPIFKVSVLDPTDVVIYEEEVTSTVDYTTGMVDTLDLIEVEFAMPDGFTSGRYTVAYEVYADGVEDYNIDDNVDTTYFYVSDTVFARDLDNMTSYTSPSTWLDGGADGEMMGTPYMFLYDTEIINMQVFINENTTPGTAIIGHAMQYNSDEQTWEDISTTALYDIEENVLGSWVNLSFTDPVMVTLDGEDAKEILLAIEFYYGGEDNDIWIGYDPRVTVSAYSCLWYMLSGSTALSWRAFGNWTRGGLGIRAITPDADLNSVPTTEAGVISIYPNPSTGLVNINNVEGASVQVLNIMGQTVASINNASVNNVIDMSTFANGTYIVRVVNGNNVTTQKINIAK